MKIDNHRLIAESKDEIIDFKETPNRSGTFELPYPDIVVIHYTAGGSLESAVNWLCNSKAKASAHLVIGKTGKIVQLVPFDEIAWHAGKSSWKGRKYLNKYSIGIELDNAGLLEKRAEGFYTYFDKRISNQKVVLATHKNEHDEKAWEAFTDKQIEAVEIVCQALIEKYNIKEIVGHDDIAPGRKVDPGPAFPMQKLKDKILFGRNDDNDNDEITESVVHGKGMVTADFLNIRTKPDINSLKVTEPLARGTKLNILDKKGDWYYVNVDMQGWVYGKWVQTSGDIS